MLDEYECPEGNDKGIFELILRLYRNVYINPNDENSIILINMYIHEKSNPSDLHKKSLLRDLIF